MPLQAARQIQTFEDGIVAISKVENVAEPGDMPKNEAVEIGTLRFADRMLGYNRLYAAKAVNEQIDRMIRVPARDEISTKCTARVGGKEYKISFVQLIVTVQPRAMDLTLARLESDE